MQPKSKKKRAAEKASNGVVSVDSNFESTGERCEGFLWMKTTGFLSKYVKRWCELSNKQLSIYYRQNGKLKEQVNIEICIITERRKRKSSSFYLEVNSDWYQHVFGTKNSSDYEMWLNKLQLSSSINLDITDGTRYTLLKHFSRDDNYDFADSFNWFNSTGTIGPISCDAEMYTTYQDKKTNNQQSVQEPVNYFSESGQVHSTQ